MNTRLTITAAAATAAASVALVPLIQGLAWLWAGIGGIAVVAAMGAAARVRVLPVAVYLLAGLAAEFLYLNAFFAGQQSWARLVPSGASVSHLGLLVSRGTAEVARYAPPVPPTPGIMLLTVAGIGFIAVVTDLLAVRLRRPAIAGLPLLVLFCVPLTTGTGATGAAAALVFCLGMAGYLALLLADGRDRLRLWGRVVRTWESRSAAYEPDTRRLAATGRRIGFAAVVIALAIPLFLPTLARHRLFPGTGLAGDGTGGGVPVSLPQPLVLLNGELHRSHPRLVLTYQSDSGPHYLQVYVLDRLSTSAWALAAPHNSARVGAGTLPLVPGLNAGTPRATIRETIQLSSFLAGSGSELSYLPAPYAPRKVSVPGEWRVSRGSLAIFSTGTPLSGQRYTVTSARAAPQGALPATGAPPASLRGDLTYPRAFASLKGLAQRITRGARSPAAKAVALQQWFRVRGGFSYSLNAPAPDNARALTDFLTHTKTGYCQQFAFGMAVLARLVGIPSRVVVGFTGGSYSGHNTWSVTTADAHAWPELYFQGYGWLRFEPTPSALGAGQATATVPSYTRDAATGSVRRQHTARSSTKPKSLPSGQAPGPIGVSRRNLPRGVAAAGASATGGSFPPSPLILLLAVLVVAAAPRTVRSVTRRRRWLTARDDTARAHAAWRELRDDLADYRITIRPGESPRALVRRLSASLGLATRGQEALARIARAEERATYSTGPLPSGQLRADVATARRALAATAGPAARWTAALLPVSVLARTRAVVSGAPRMFQWLDTLRARLRHRQPADRDAEAAYSWRS